MNLINLKRIFNYILLNVPEEKLDMSHFRLYGDLNSHECKTVGCVIGHCTILDDFEKIPKNQNGEIYFEKWSENFTGLDFYSDEWEWCFSSGWSKYYITKTKEQILLRIKFLIKNKRIPKKFDTKKNWLFYLDSKFILNTKKELKPYKI